MISVVIVFQPEDTPPVEVKTGTPALPHYDPLALDLEDLYVKYKVSRS